MGYLAVQVTTRLTGTSRAPGVLRSAAGGSESLLVKVYSSDVFSRIFRKGQGTGWMC